VDDVTIGGLLDILADALADRLAARVHAGDGAAVKPRLLTADQASVYLGRTREAIEHMIAAGKLPTVRSDRRVFLDVCDLDRWIQQNKS
jgi:excisionase family DNA binding protein